MYTIVLNIMYKLRIFVKFVYLCIKIIKYILFLIPDEKNEDAIVYTQHREFGSHEKPYQEVKKKKRKHRYGIKSILKYDIGQWDKHNFLNGRIKNCMLLRDS